MQVTVSHAYCVTAPTKSGMPILEKVPNGVYRFWVDGNGHIRRLNLTNGSSIRDWEQDPYALQQMAKKREAGWVEYNACPLSDPRSREFVPLKMRDDKVCSAPTNLRECCKHVKAIIDKRMTRHKKAEAEKHRKMLTSDDILKETYLANKDGSVRK